MATVVKDFKIKSGLVVQGTTGTINGFDILTKKEDDLDFIIDVIGGETLVKSVSSEFDVSEAGELSLNRTTVDAYYDAAGSADAAEAAAIAAAATDASTKADAAQAAAEAFATAADTTLYGTVTTDIATAKSEAGVIAQGYADAAQSAAEAFATAADTTLYGTVTTDIATAKGEAIAAAEADATTKADAALASANTYTDTEIGNLVGSAPELLDTLQELAAALEDNPDVIADLREIAAGKQDALTAGANIDITDDVISVTGLVASDISDFDSAAVTANTGLWDTIGDAAAAEAAANLYTDGEITTALTTAQGYADTAQSNAEQFATDAINALDTDDIEEGTENLYFLDSRAVDAVAAAIAEGEHENVEITYQDGVLTFVAENGVADSTTDDLEEGEENLYFLDSRAVDALQGTNSMFETVSIDEVALQVASTLTAETAGIQTAYAWAKADYRSAEFLVKVAYSTHTEISKVLLTLDTSDNIAITEYGIVGTNGSASTVSAGISGTDVQLLVTTTNNDSTVTVMGTLLA
jgi:hypothetical protein